MRHNVNVMHVQKTICDILREVLLDIKGRTKDTLNERCELMRMKIRKEIYHTPEGDNRSKLPLACYTLISSE